MQFNIHKDFQLNGSSFHNEKELLLFSKTFSKPISSFLSQFLDNLDSVSMKTSGSTGTPKLIEIRKEFMVNSARATGKFFSLNEGTTALLCINPEFVAGKMMLVRAMLLGWKLDVVEASMTPLTEVKKKYDFSAMVPLQVYNSIEELYNIKTLIVGGGVASTELKSLLQDVSTEVFATYGMTETLTHIAVKRLNQFSLDTERSRSVYKILPNISISLDDRGCLVIGAPKIASDKVVTNDLVKIISDNEFQWLGRYDSIVNSGGIKIIPEVIEDKLSEIINERFFIAGIPDEKLGEKVVLVVEGNVTSSAVEKSQKIRNNIIELNILSKYETPKEIYFVEKFIETETKKIQRKKTLDLIKF